uniref:Uncharacterized protein n=1 Tax=Acrobeloides nanus TaxID=290746 RepID=A0A914E8Z6_9BILA
MHSNRNGPTLGKDFISASKSFSPVKFPNVVMILLVVDVIFTPVVGSPFALNGLRMDAPIDRVYEVV